MPLLPINWLNLLKAPVGPSTPAILDDGNTVAWYDLDNVVKDGSDLVSQWTDITGLGHHLVQGNGARQPLWSATGILFDGSLSNLRTAGFTFNQPNFIYMVWRQVTWTNNDIILDGIVNNGTQLAQKAGTPVIRANAGNPSANMGQMTLNTFKVTALLFNGASSRMAISDAPAAVGDFGSNNMGGFALGSRSDGVISNSNIEVKEAILRKIADTDANETIIHDYLKNKYGL